MRNILKTLLAVTALTVLIGAVEARFSHPRRSFYASLLGRHLANIEKASTAGAGGGSGQKGAEAGRS
jgi:hypothetical protein